MVIMVEDLNIFRINKEYRWYKLDYKDSSKYPMFNPYPMLVLTNNEDIVKNMEKEIKEFNSYLCATADELFDYIKDHRSVTGNFILILEDNNFKEELYPAIVELISNIHFYELLNTDVCLESIFIITNGKDTEVVKNELIKETKCEILINNIRIYKSFKDLLKDQIEIE